MIPFRLFIVVVLTLELCRPAAGDDVRSAPLQQHALEMLPGVVEPTKSVALAAPFDGVLMEVAVVEGEAVGQDQVVAIMDNRVAKAALHAARESATGESDVRLAEQELATAKKFLARVTQAHQKSAASDVELDQAQSALDQAHIKLDLAREQRARRQSQLELEEARVATHNILAPFPGRVIKVEGRVGQSLNRADDVLTVANLKRLRVDLQVPIRWFRQLKVGQQYWLAAYAPVKRPIAAQLISFEPQVDAATRTFRCRFEIDNIDQSLPSGFAVRLIDPDKTTSPASEVDVSVSSVHPNIRHPAR